MAAATTLYSAEDVAQRGAALYERDIRAQVEAGHAGQVVAIDVHSGAYELAADALTSVSRLRARVPEAEIWVVRVGQRTYRKLRQTALRHR